MATSKPRLLVVIEPRQRELLRRLSVLQGHSMAWTVRQLLDLVEPQLVDLVAALEAAQAAQGKPAVQLLAALEKLNAGMQLATQKAVGQADMFSGQVAKAKRRLVKQVATAKQSVRKERRRAARAKN